MKQPQRLTTGQLIRRRRLAAKLTQQDLARKCGWTSKAMIAHYEAGRTVPLVSNLQLIARALGCPISKLIPA